MSTIRLLFKSNLIYGPKNVLFIYPILRFSSNLFKNYQRVLKKKKISLNESIQNTCKYCLISEIDKLNFEKICEETLESLSDYFEQLCEESSNLENADISFSDGVLTINLGNNFGTYVINRQSPNKQIWLSSPISGPKRYDFINNCWIYKHDGQCLHQLLQNELSQIVKNVNFSKCLYAKNINK